MLFHAGLLIAYLLPTKQQPLLMVPLLAAKVLCQLILELVAGRARNWNCARLWWPWTETQPLRHHSLYLCGAEQHAVRRAFWSIWTAGPQIPCGLPAAFPYPYGHSSGSCHAVDGRNRRSEIRLLEALLLSFLAAAVSLELASLAHCYI